MRKLSTEMRDTLELLRNQTNTASEMRKDAERSIGWPDDIVVQIEKLYHALDATAYVVTLQSILITYMLEESLK